MTDDRELDARDMAEEMATDDPDDLVGCEYHDSRYDPNSDEGCPECRAYEARAKARYGWMADVVRKSRVTEDDLQAYELGSSKREALERIVERGGY